MKPLRKTLVIALLCLVTASAGYAQQDGKDIPVRQEPKLASPDEWRVTFTPYFWLPTVDLNISVPDVNVGNRTIGGDVSVYVPWWDTLSKFSGNFYVLELDGRLEAWKGRWGGFIDGYWIFGKSNVGGGDSRLILRDRVDVITTSSAKIKFDLGQLNFGPQYVLGTAPLSPTSNVSFILYGGGRVNWIGVDVDGTLRIAESANVGEIGQNIRFGSNRDRVFVEPMIGFKTNWTIGKNLQAIVRGDVGGFGFVTANNWDCDLEAALAWEAWRNTYLDVGYRARGQWQDFGANGNGALSGWVYGPEVGLTFKF